MKKILLSSILLFGVGLVSSAQEKHASSAGKNEKVSAKSETEMLASKAKASKTTADVTSSLNQAPVYVSKRDAMKAAASKKN